MAVFRIQYVESKRRPNQSNWVGHLFQVFAKAEEHPCQTIQVFVAPSDIHTLQYEKGLQGFPERERIQQAVIRYAIQRIEHGLREGLFPTEPSSNTYNLPLQEEKDIAAIRQLLQGKTCTYQRQEGRDLLCSAASKHDKTAYDKIGFRVIAPTSQAMCYTCTFPDTDYLCSHFLHPEVLAERDGNARMVRQLVHGVCDIGRDEVHQPEKCRTGGHGCWEWLIEPIQEQRAIISSPSLAPAVRVQKDRVKEHMSRVFISYVHENSKDVMRLIEALKTHEVSVWFDQTHLKPGDRWANVIRQEISQGDFFIACFSTEYSNKPMSYMNEEITQAIEQLRQRPSDKPWFIPALLSDCEIPDRNIGGGETLRSFQWVALYDDWNAGVKRILEVVQPNSEVQSLDEHHQNVYSEAETLSFLPRSTADILNDRQCERTGKKFSVIHNNHPPHPYTRQEVDRLTPTQRERLFVTDPEMQNWWRGKAMTNGAWPLFRIQGGTWISKGQIDQALSQISEEQKDALWKIPGLNEWCVDGLVF